MLTDTLVRGAKPVRPSAEAGRCPRVVPAGDAGRREVLALRLQFQEQAPDAGFRRQHPRGRAPAGLTLTQ
jgi:hypothetical protein